MTVTPLTSRTARRPDGDRGLTRAQRSERTAALLAEAVVAGDTESRRLLDEVIVINRGVAESVASRYYDRGVDREDLRQVAYEGLTKAVRRFDPATRNDLLTFAVPTIRGELLRYFRDRGWAVRPPRRIQELQWRVNQAIEALEGELGHTPSTGEIVDRMGITEAEYREACEAFGAFQVGSLDQPVAADSTASIGDLLPARDGEAAASEARLTLGPAVRALSERDRRVLHLRFFDDLTQEEIGRDLGVTQMQVSRLLGRILDTLRTEIGDQDVLPASA